MTLPGLTRSLKELMERSPLGEFEARLQMLRSFHCHTLYLYPEDSGEERPVTRGRGLRYHRHLVSIQWGLGMMF